MAASQKPLREQVADALAYNDACGPGPVSRREYLADADVLTDLIAGTMLRRIREMAEIVGPDAIAGTARTLDRTAVVLALEFGFVASDQPHGLEGPENGQDVAQGHGDAEGDRMSDIEHSVAKIERMAMEAMREAREPYGLTDATHSRSTSRLKTKAERARDETRVQTLCDVLYVVGWCNARTPQEARMWLRESVAPSTTGGQ